MPEIAVVTGGSAGIGRATAIVLARHGYWVGILARDPTRVEAVCEEIRVAGGHALGIPTDVAEAAQVEHSADRTEHELGVISVWVKASVGHCSARDHSARRRRDIAHMSP